MNELTNIEFQWYLGDIRNTKPQGKITLHQFIDRHQNPTEEILSVFDEIERAAANGDKKLKSKLKMENLFFFTPSALFKQKRRYSDIVGFTGLAQIDVDGLEEDEAIDLKEHLFSEYKQFYVVFVSPSRKGVKGLIRIPIVSSVDEYKEYYKGIEDEFDWLPGFDSAPKNLALPLFLSYDTDLLYRESAEVWTKKGELRGTDDVANLRPQPRHSKINGDHTTYKSDAYYRMITLNIYEKKINAITGNGHPQVLSASLVLGSRVGAGYLSQSEAEQYAEYCIKNNEYLSKGPNGYIKTMRWCINKAINNPKYYE